MGYFVARIKKNRRRSGWYQDLEVRTRCTIKDFGEWLKDSSYVIGRFETRQQEPKGYFADDLQDATQKAKEAINGTIEDHRQGQGAR